MHKLAVIALLLTATTAQAQQEAKDLPRYKLTPGQHFSFASSMRASGSFPMESTATAQYWVLRKNDNNTHRFLYQLAGKHKYGNSPAEDDSALLLFDLSDTGEITNATQSYSADPSGNLPRLPTTEAEAANGYTTTDKYGDTNKLKLLSDPHDPKPRIEITADGISSKIYGLSSTTLWTFDATLGLPLRADFLTTQTYGAKSNGRSTTDRTTLDTLPEADLAKLATDAQTYTTATDAYIAIIRAGEADPNAYAKARKILTDAKSALTNPLFLSDLAAKLAQHDSSAQYAETSAKERAAVLNKPAFPFNTTDLTGKPHSLADYKGKVIVLDFWYRGCGWCIRAMPQVKQLATDFKDQPVAILGMNTDKNEEDATFVIKTLDLNYPTLKAEGLPEKYSVRGFPTLLIIDQQGQIRDIHVGYSPTLRTEVTASIQKLLSESTAKP